MSGVVWRHAADIEGEWLATLLFGPGRDANLPLRHRVLDTQTGKGFGHRLVGFVLTRRSGRDRRISTQSLDTICQLPGHPEVIATEVSICGCRAADRPQQGHIRDDRPRTEVGMAPRELEQLGLRGRAGAECLDSDRCGMRPPA